LFYEIQDLFPVIVLDILMISTYSFGIPIKTGGISMLLGNPACFSLSSPAGEKEVNTPNPVHVRWFLRHWTPGGRKREQAMDS
jgi:hypothetical protein